MKKDEYPITLPQLAARLGLHRSTLCRMEERGVIDKAPVVGRPVLGRVYDEDLAKKVTKQVEDYFAGRVANVGTPRKKADLMKEIVQPEAQEQPDGE